MKKIFVCLLLLMLAVPACAEENIPLFKEYYYGMPYDAVKKISHATPCKGEMTKDKLCMPNDISFGKQKWTQIFSFSDGKLTQVLLGKKAERNNLESAMETIGGNGYSMLLVSTKTKRLDVIASSRLDGEDPGRLLRTFVHENSSEEKMIFSFFDDKTINKILADSGIKDFYAFQEAAPIGVRSVDVTLNNNFLILQFLAPKAALLDKEKNKQEIKEKF